MNIYAIFNSVLICATGLLVICLTASNWDHPGKTIRIKMSEIGYGLLFIVNGLFALVLFRYENISFETSMELHKWIFFVFAAILFWIWVLNVLVTYIRIKRRPELLNSDAEPCRDFDTYFSRLEDQYETDTGKKDIIKDLSRKFLHFLIIAVVVVSHEYAFSMKDVLASWGLTPLAGRNFVYFAAAFSFILMFTSEDILRVYNFKLLPDWALKWIDKSLELKTEKYTYISSVPFLLSLMIFLLAPFQVLLCAAVVSCISDSLASIAGKSFGRHKLEGFGFFPEKSWEGLIAGALSAFVGVYLVFEFYPMAGVTLSWQLGFAFIATASFIYADIFSRYLVDNINNTVLPGAFTWISMVLFL